MRHTSNISSDSVTLGKSSNLGTHVDNSTDSLVSGDQLHYQHSPFTSRDLTYGELGNELSLVDVSIGTTDTTDVDY